MMGDREDDMGKVSLQLCSRLLTFSFTNTEESFGIDCDLAPSKDLTGNALRIMRIRPGSIACVDGRLRLNDLIVKINGRDIRQEVQHTSRWLLENAMQTGSVTLTVERRKRQAPPPPLPSIFPPSPPMPRPASSQNSHRSLFRLKSAPPGVTAKQQNNNHVGSRFQPLSNRSRDDVRVFAKHGSLTKLEWLNSEDCLLTSSESSLTGADSPVFFFSNIFGESSQSSEESQLRQKKLHRKRVRETHTMHLLKVDSSLGIQIAGGRGSKKGDIGIFVASVTPGGAADKDGRLCRGDQIITVNGTDMTSVTHSEAVAIIKGSPNLIQLVISRKRRRLSKTKSSASSLLSSSSSSFYPCQSSETSRPSQSSEPSYASHSSETSPSVISPLSKTFETLSVSEKCNSEVNGNQNVVSYLTEVVLFKEDGVGLGVAVTCRLSSNQCALLVRDLSPTSVARQLLICGDEILSINGQSVAILAPKHAEEMVRDLPPGPVTLLIRRQQISNAYLSDSKSMCNAFDNDDGDDDGDGGVFKEPCDTGIPKEILDLDKISTINMAFRGPSKMVIIESGSVKKESDINSNNQHEVLQTCSGNNSRNTNSSSNNLVKSFISKFDSPSQGSSPRSVEARHVVKDDISDGDRAKLSVTNSSENKQFATSFKPTTQSSFLSPGQNTAAFLGGPRNVVVGSHGTASTKSDWTLSKLLHGKKLSSPRQPVTVRSPVIISKSPENKPTTAPVVVKRVETVSEKPDFNRVPLRSTTISNSSNDSGVIKNETGDSDDEYRPVSVKNMLSKFSQPSADTHRLIVKPKTESKPREAKDIQSMEALSSFSEPLAPMKVQSSPLSFPPHQSSETGNKNGVTKPVHGHVSAELSVSLSDKSLNLGLSTSDSDANGSSPETLEKSSPALTDNVHVNGKEYSTNDTGNEVLSEILKVRQRLSKTSLWDEDILRSFETSNVSNVGTDLGKLATNIVSAHSSNDDVSSYQKENEQEMRSVKKVDISVFEKNNITQSPTSNISPRQHSPVAKSPTILERSLDKLEIISKSTTDQEYENEQETQFSCGFSGNCSPSPLSRGIMPSTSRSGVETVIDVSPTGGSMVRQMVEQFQVQSSSYPSRPDSIRIPESSGASDNDVVTLIRLPGENLGMSLHIEGNNETHVIEGVFVESVEPGGAADRASGGSGVVQGIQCGDEILEINGTSLQDLTRSEVVSVFDELPLRIFLTVKRHQVSPRLNSSMPLNSSLLRTETPMIEAVTPLPESPSVSPTFFNSRPESQMSSVIGSTPRNRHIPDGFELVKFSVYKGDTDSLGITIVPGYGSTSQYYQVKRILSSGVCAKDGHMRVGDRLVSCNGCNLGGVSQTTCTEILKNVCDNIHFEVLRPINSSGDMWHTFHSLPSSTDNSFIDSQQSTVKTNTNSIVLSPLSMELNSVNLVTTEQYNEGSEGEDSDESVYSEDDVNEWSPQHELNSSLDDVKLEGFMVHDNKAQTRTVTEGPQMNSSVMYGEDLSDTSESESCDVSESDKKPVESQHDVGPSLQRSVMYGVSSDDDDNDSEDDDGVAKDEEEIDPELVMKSFDDILLEEDSDDEVREVFVKPDYSSVKLDHITLLEQQAQSSEPHKELSKPQPPLIPITAHKHDSPSRETFAQSPTDASKAPADQGARRKELPIPVSVSPIVSSPKPRPAPRQRPSLFSIVKSHAPPSETGNLADVKTDDVPVTDIDAILDDISSRETSESSQVSSRQIGSSLSPLAGDHLSEPSKLTHEGIDDSSFVAETSVEFKQALANPFEELEREFDSEFKDETENDVDDLPEDLSDLEMDDEADGQVMTKGRRDSFEDKADMDTLNVAEEMVVYPETVENNETTVKLDDTSAAEIINVDDDNDVIDLDDDESFNKQSLLTTSYLEKSNHTDLLVEQPVYVIDLDSSSTLKEPDITSDANIEKFGTKDTEENHHLVGELEDLSSEDEDVAELTDFIKEKVQSIVAEEAKIAEGEVGKEEKVTKVDADVNESCQDIETIENDLNKSTNLNENCVVSEPLVIKSRSEQRPASNILDDLLKMRSKLTVGDDEESGLGSDDVGTLSTSMTEEKGSEQKGGDSDGGFEVSVEDEVGLSSEEEGGGETSLGKVSRQEKELEAGDNCEIHDDKRDIPKKDIPHIPSLVMGSIKSTDMVEELSENVEKLAESKETVPLVDVNISRSDDNCLKIVSENKEPDSEMAVLVEPVKSDVILEASSLEAATTSIIEKEAPSPDVHVKPAVTNKTSYQKSPRLPRTPLTKIRRSDKVTADSLYTEWSGPVENEEKKVLQNVPAIAAPRPLLTSEPTLAPKKHLSLSAKIFSLGKSKKHEDKFLKPIAKPFKPKLFSRPATVGEPSINKLSVPKALSTSSVSQLKPVAHGSRSEMGIFQIDVMKGILGLGISVKARNGHFVVSEVKRSGPVGRSGCVKVGDYLVALNSTCLSHLSDTKVQHIMKLVPRGTVSLYLSVGVPTLDDVASNEGILKSRPCLDGKSDSSRASSPHEVTQLSSSDTSTDDSSTLQPPSGIRSPPDGDESSPPVCKNSSAQNGSSNKNRSSKDIHPLAALFIRPPETSQRSQQVEIKSNEPVKGETDNDVDLKMTSGTLEVSQLMHKAGCQPRESVKEIAITDVDHTNASESIDHNFGGDVRSAMKSDTPKAAYEFKLERSKIANVSDVAYQNNISKVSSAGVEKTQDIVHNDADSVESKELSIELTSNQSAASLDLHETDTCSSEVIFEPMNTTEVTNERQLEDVSGTGHEVADECLSSDVKVTCIDEGMELSETAMNNHSSLDAKEGNSSDKSNLPDASTNGDPGNDTENLDSDVTPTHRNKSSDDVPSKNSYNILAQKSVSLHVKRPTSKSELHQVPANSAKLKDDTSAPRSVHSDTCRTGDIKMLNLSAENNTGDNATTTSSDEGFEVKTFGSLGRSSFLRSTGLKPNNKMNMFLRDDSKFKVPELKVGSSEKTAVLAKPNSASKLKGLQLPSKKPTLGTGTNQSVLRKLPKLGTVATPVIKSVSLQDSSKESRQHSEIKCDGDAADTNRQKGNVKRITENFGNVDTAHKLKSNLLPLKKFQPLNLSAKQLTAKKENTVSNLSTEVYASTEVCADKSHVGTLHMTSEDDVPSAQPKIKVDEAPPVVDLTQSSSSEGLSLSSASDVFGGSHGSQLLWTPRSKRTWSLTSTSDADSLHQSLSASMASVGSLISQDELAELLAEANRSLDENGVDDDTPIRVVVLHKQAHESIGIGLAPADGGSFKVSTIEPNSVAQTEHVHVGHFLLSVNGETLKGLSQDEAMRKLSTSRQQVVLVLSPAVSHDNPARCLDEQDLSSTSPVPTTTIDTIPHETLPRDTKSRDVGDTVVVDLPKGKTGLGFCLEGGRESPLGPQPIRVKRIFKGSIMTLKGILSVGDEIIQANGVDFSTFTHHQAWNFLKSQPEGVIKVEVRRV